MKVTKWLLEHWKVLKGLYIAWYILWQTAIAAVALTWLTLIGLVLCKLPSLDTLPKMVIVYLGVGVGLATIVASVIGLIIVLSVLTDNWWKWTKRSVFKIVRNKTWDLEYTVQQAKQAARHEEAAALAKLAELKDPKWEV